MAKCEWTVDKIVAENIGTYEDPLTQITVFLRGYTCDKYVVYEVVGPAAEDLDSELIDALNRFLSYAKTAHAQNMRRYEMTSKQYWDAFIKSH